MRIQCADSDVVSYLLRCFCGARADFCRAGCADTPQQQVQRNIPHVSCWKYIMYASAIEICRIRWLAATTIPLPWIRVNECSILASPVALEIIPATWCRGQTRKGLSDFFRTQSHRAYGSQLKRGLRDRDSPTCTLSQNGYGNQWSATCGWLATARNGLPLPTARNMRRLVDTRLRLGGP